MTNDKPSHTEDEYFAREDAERLRKLHYEEQERLAQAEKDALRTLHHGRCPNCGAQLVPESVSRLKVQHCPSCGGAFLERSAWEQLHLSTDHSLMGSVLNWFRAANKP